MDSKVNAESDTHNDHRGDGCNQDLVLGLHRLLFGFFNGHDGIWSKRKDLEKKKRCMKLRRRKCRIEKERRGLIEGDWRGVEICI